jgi:hypothetical protein
MRFLRRFQIYDNRSIIQPGENEWGFGQIIAMVLTLGIFIDIVAAIRERQKKTAEDLENSPKTKFDVATQTTALTKGELRRGVSED